jgi:copper oxidase (laccase) domain-containing protein
VSSPDAAPHAPTVPVATWDMFGGTALDAVVTTRAGGVSAGVYESLNLSLGVGDDVDRVVENRRRAAWTTSSSRTRSTGATSPS